MRNNPLRTLFSTLIIFCLVGCSIKQYIPEGEQFYLGINNISISDATKDKYASLAINDLKKVLERKPNGAFLGSSSAKLSMPFTSAFWLNKHANPPDAIFGRWLSKNFGEAPILISDVNPHLRAQVGKQILDEYGFFHSSVTAKIEPSNDSILAAVSYEIKMGSPHVLDSISYHIPIITPDSIDLASPEDRLLHKGEPFGVLLLENERLRISQLLRDKGYYFFKPELIQFLADTIQTPQQVQLKVTLSEEILPEAYEPWKIGKIVCNLYPNEEERLLSDSILYQGVVFKYNGTKPPVNLSLLRQRIRLKSEEYYNQQQQSNTLRLLADLNTFAYNNIAYTPRTEEQKDNYLDVLINSTIDRPYFTEFEAVYKRKSNNQTGTGAGFTLNKKNIFGGGELLTIALRGGYEWETRRNTSSLSGEARKAKWDINSYELSLSGSLTYPRMLLPSLMRRDLNFPTSTRLYLSSGILNRKAFYRQAQFVTNLAYRLEPNDFVRHTIQPLSITYTHLLQTTEKFMEAITKNPSLALSFQNQFIPQMSYLFGFEYHRPLSKHFVSIETYAAESGNLLSLFYRKGEKKAPYNHTLFRAPFAQFVKSSLELRYRYQIASDLQLASRLFGGVVYSYGNTLVTPYTEQFYSGGANSLRGFNVRSIGPGSYNPIQENALSFLDRTGDLRLEANLEARYKIIGILELATFLDLGNVWLLRDSESHPDGAISSQHLLQDLALNSGLGIRFDLSYLVVRLDLGVALHQPSRKKEHYINTFRDKTLPLVFHIAVGYPF